MSSEQIDAPLLPPEPMAEPKSVRLGFVTGLVAVDKLQVCVFCIVHWGRDHLLNPVHLDGDNVLCQSVAHDVLATKAHVFWPRSTVVSCTSPTATCASS